MKNIFIIMLSCFLLILLFGIIWLTSIKSNDSKKNYSLYFEKIKSFENIIYSQWFYHEFKSNTLDTNAPISWIAFWDKRAYSWSSLIDTIFPNDQFIDNGKSISWILEYHLTQELAEERLLNLGDIQDESVRIIVLWDKSILRLSNKIDFNYQQEIVNHLEIN